MSPARRKHPPRPPFVAFVHCRQRWRSIDGMRVEVSRPWCARRTGDPEKWDRRNMRRMVEGAFQVRLRQDKKAGKLYLTIFELRDSGWWEALRHADELGELLSQA